VRHANTSLKIRFLILLLLTGVLFALTPEPNDTTAISAFQQGAQGSAYNRLESGADAEYLLLAPSSHHDAEAALRLAISRRHLDPQPWRLLGDLFAEWGQPDDALYAYGQAISHGDDEAVADQSLARLYAIFQDDRQAREHWIRYLARRPFDREARLALAWTNVNLADWKGAAAELQRLLTDRSDDLFVHAWLGLLNIGPNPEQGIDHLQRAAENPELAAFITPVLSAHEKSVASGDPAYRSALLGIALLELDAPAFLKTQAAGPDLLRYSLAGAEHAITTLALRSFLAATHRNPAYADAYAYMGQAFDQLGWPGWARAALFRALEIAPQSPVVQTLLGLFWDRRGASALARHYYETAYLQDQRNPGLCLEISDTYAAEGNYTAAEVWLFYAVEIAPNDPLVWGALARFYLDFGIGVEQSGLTAARRLLDLSPNDARAHDLMGWAYFLAGEYDRAKASLTRALTIDPRLASAHFHLGRLLAHLGDYDSASEAYRRAANADTEGQLAEQLARAWMEMPESFQERP
jgi:tetratricopeptide (TPR) repeat protein